MRRHMLCSRGKAEGRAERARAEPKAALAAGAESSRRRCRVRQTRPRRIPGRNATPPANGAVSGVPRAQTAGRSGVDTVLVVNG